VVGGVSSPFAYLGRHAVRFIDSLLVRIYGVRTYSDDPECILRIASKPLTLPKPVVLPDGTELGVGAKLIEIHFWNEHLPPIQDEGADLLFGRQFATRLAYSLGLLAAYAAGHPDLEDFAAIHGQLSFIQQEEVDSFKRLAWRFGLLLERRESAGLRFWKGAFWAGLYSWWLMWTFNPGTLRRKRFRDVALSDIWMTRSVMLDRYRPRQARLDRPTILGLC
jgi:hypothetical protein